VKAVDPAALFHPDYTVGSGISPDLLTPSSLDEKRSRAPGFRPIPPVGNFTPP
jgi:hypothetical protein